MIALTNATTVDSSATQRTLFDTVLVKVAARCNLACSYCYFFFSEDQRWRRQPAQMSLPIFEALARNLEDVLEVQQRGFAVTLHGGEPLLLGEQRLEQSLAILRRTLPSERIPISVQTNGVLITERMLDICSDLRVTLSVSIDGFRAVNDHFRLTHGGKSSFDQTVEGIRRLRDHRDSEYLFSGTLSVVNPTIAPDEVYSFLKGLGSPKLDFLFRDGNHDRLPFEKESFDSTEYGDWLCRLWDIYVADPTPVPIRILDDTAKLILGATNQKEGIGLSPFSIIIVDTDGSLAKNDTLKSSFEGADAFTGRWNVTTDRLVDVAQTEEYRDYLRLPVPTSDVCQNCRHLRVCGGGMPLYRWRQDSGYSNPSVYCRDHQRVIEHVSASLCKHLARPR